MNKICNRNLFIGLGGRGIDAILNTKAKLMEEYGDSLPSFLGFMGIDTDKGTFSRSISVGDKAVSLLPNEYYCLSVADPRSVYSSYQKEYPWFPEQNLRYLNALDWGAGSIRSNGRLAFQYNKEGLAHFFNGMLLSACSCTANQGDYPYSPLTIHLVFSLCGGTGSGIFLHLAYLLQEILQKANINARICAYAIMPDALDATPGTMLSYMEGNTFAALMELDYIKHLEFGSPVYPPFPFHSFSLMGGSTNNGSIYQKGEVCEKIAQLLVFHTGSNFIDSVQDNLAASVINGAFNYSNKKAWVGSMGIATASDDNKEAIETACYNAVPGLKVDSHGCIIGAGEGMTELGASCDYYCLVPKEKREPISAMLEKAFWKPDKMNIENNCLNDRTMFFTLRYPIPVFAINGIEKLQESYNHLKDNRSFQIDKQLWEHIESEGFSIFPQR